MGNVVSKEGLTNAEVPVYDQDFLKKQVEHLKLARPIVKSRTPHESEYDQASAYGIVAYRNQNQDSKSDLDLARMNFEKKYESFLNWYGQYSNQVIKKSNNDVITYPVTKFFDGYDWRIPTQKPTTSPSPSMSPSTSPSMSPSPSPTPSPSYSMSPSPTPSYSMRPSPSPNPTPT